LWYTSGVNSRAIIAFAVLAAATAAWAGGLVPDRVNQVVLTGEFSGTPSFLAVFSATPFADSQGRLITSLSAAEVAALGSTSNRLVLKLHGKPVAVGGRCEYSFGTKADSGRPWNDGREFDWRDWAKFSPDVWDHAAIVAAPDSRGAGCKVAQAALRRGGQLLFDSRVRQSYPNKRPLDVTMPVLDLAPVGGRFPVLNLSARMERFRRAYYELGDNPLLLTAYADLGQTERRKYANRGANWCSEFASHVYRTNRFMTPDPDRGDVHWKNMRECFEKNGRVYTAREVASWPDAQKLRVIKPGSFVSILIGESTHSMIFTTWLLEPGRPVQRYVCVSGNNKGMVWSHAPQTLPVAANWNGKAAAELKDFDQKVFFGVPP
jgi:hypothetical protein